MLFFRVLAFLFINWLIINLGFYFHQTRLPIADYHFMSHLFIQVKEIIHSWMPLPFPRPFIEGLDMAKYYDQLGGGYQESSFGNVTILGHSATGGSFWYYYLISILYKTPVSYFILLTTAFILLVRKRETRISF